MPHMRLATASEELVDGLLEHVEERTHGRIRHLKVERDEGRLVLSGRAGSYYLLQLALAAVREVAPGLVDVRIEVTTEPGWGGHFDPPAKGSGRRPGVAVPAPHLPHEELQREPAWQ